MQETGDIAALLIGTWRLVSAQRREIPSGATFDAFGSNPSGTLTYTPEGRMIALLVRSDRSRPAGDAATPGEATALFGSMIAYCGSYSVAKNEVTHHVDLSWNELWTGTKQVRVASFEGNRLVLATHPSPDPLHGKWSVRTMTWERMPAAGAELT